jgi:predicted phosphoribosyltransferase
MASLESQVERRGAFILERTALRERVGVFRDRAHGGQVLAELLRGRLAPDTVVLGIPPGGLPVAAALAEELGLPLDVAVVTPITLPWDVARAFGAVGFDGSVRLNQPLVAYLGLGVSELEHGAQKAKARLGRRLSLYRAGARPLSLGGRGVVLVDQGLASGFTMSVAVDAAKNAGAARVAVAVPTGASDALDALTHDVELLACANVRTGKAFSSFDAYLEHPELDDASAALVLHDAWARQEQARARHAGPDDRLL